MDGLLTVSRNIVIQELLNIKDALRYVTSRNVDARVLSC